MGDFVKLKKGAKMTSVRDVQNHNFESFLRSQDTESLQKMRFYANTIADRQARIENLWMIASELAKRDPRY